MVNMALFEPQHDRRDPCFLGHPMIFRFPRWLNPHCWRFSTYYPLVNVYSFSELEAMAIEIVDLPSYKMVIFHSYVKVYQRVIPSLFQEHIPIRSRGYHHFKRWWNPQKTLQTLGFLVEISRAVALQVV